MEKWKKMWHSHGFCYQLHSASSYPAISSSVFFNFDFAIFTPPELNFFLFLHFLKLDIHFDMDTCGMFISNFWLVKSTCSIVFPEKSHMINQKSEGVHLTLPPHLFSVQGKSGASYITSQCWRVDKKIKET